KEIACIWQERIGYEYGKLKWSRFDGKAWSAPEEIAQGKRQVTNPVSRPPVHAVSLGGKEIFLASALFPGVLHYHEGRWKRELPEVPVGGRVSVAGDKTVMVIAPVQASGTFGKGPVVLRSWQRGPDGWSPAVDLAKEERPLSHKHDN